MNQVASKVGFATASLYNDFQDKDDLLHFCYCRLVEPCLQAIQEAARADLSTTQKLERILRTALEHAVEHKGLIKLMAGMDYHSKIRRDTRPRLLQILTTIFQRGSRKVPFARTTPRIRAASFSGVCWRYSICRPAARRIRTSTASLRR